MRWVAGRGTADATARLGTAETGNVGEGEVAMALALGLR